MTAEQKLHEWLRKRLEPCHYQRIESAASGLPDVSIGKQGLSRWCELKVVTACRTLLRKEQYAFLCKSAAHRVPVFVVSWHQQVDQIFVWNPLHVVPTVTTYSKYLAIISSPQHVGIRKSLPIETILFTH